MNLRATSDLNPYVAPDVAAKDDAKPCDVEDYNGIPHAGYLKLRRANVYLVLNMQLFFVGVGVPVISRSETPMMEAAVWSLFWIGPAFVLWATLRNKTAEQAKLTFVRYRAGSQALRQMCLWMGPISIVVGLAARAILPAKYDGGFSVLLLVCGIVAFATSFVFPSVGTRNL